jgi:hypothetical protein
MEMVELKKLTQSEQTLEWETQVDVLMVSVKMSGERNVARTRGCVVVDLLSCNFVLMMSSEVGRDRAWNHSILAREAGSQPPTNTSAFDFSAGYPNELTMDGAYDQGALLGGSA